MERCSLSIYHLRLLSYLFVVIFTTSIAVLWARRRRTVSAVSHLWAWLARSQPVSDCSAITIALVRDTLASALCAASFAVLTILVSEIRAPYFDQPAMAVPAFCFLRNTIPHALRPALKGRLFPKTFIGVTVGILLSIVVVYFMVFVIVLRRRSTSLDVRRCSSSLGVGCIFVIGLYILTLIVAPMGYMSDRGHAQQFIDQATAENAWGFGQVIPVFLLLVPIFTFVGALTGTSVTAGLPPSGFPPVQSAP
jgi:hypothetical protein